MALDRLDLSLGGGELELKQVRLKVAVIYAAAHHLVTEIAGAFEGGLGKESPTVH